MREVIYAIIMEKEADLRRNAVLRHRPVTKISVISNKRQTYQFKLKTI